MGGGDVLQKLSSEQNLLLGITTGAASKCINYPLLVAKNRTQQGLPMIFNPKLVYRGLPIGLVNIGGTTGCQFFFTGVFMKLLCTEGEVTGVQQTAAALLGGVTSGIPCSLWELTMIQQQRFGGSVYSVPRRLIEDYGVTSLGRGVVMSCVRESLFTGAMLAMCPLLQREIVNRCPSVPNDMALGAGALCSAFCAATATHPADTIKTCMQGDCGREKYTGILSTGMKLTEEYGMAKGLFKGLTYRIGLIATTFFLVNKFKVLFAPNMFPSLAESGNAEKDK